MVNKKGWIKVIEASVSVLLVAGFIILIMNTSDLKGENYESEIYNSEKNILRTIQLDNNLRNGILETQGEIGMNGEAFPNDLRIIINEKKPVGVLCSAKICDVGDSCALEESHEKSVYTQSILITSNLTLYNPRVLKIFCWEN